MEHSIDRPLSNGSGSIAATTHLIDCYRQEMPFFFSSPAVSLLVESSDQCQPLALKLENSLAEQCESLLKKVSEEGAPQAMIVGAIPFDNLQPCRLWLANAVRREIHGEAPRVAVSRKRVGIPVQTMRQRPLPCEFESSVDKALVCMRKGALQKVVMARTLEIEGVSSFPCEQVVQCLAAGNALGYTFALDLPVPFGSPASTLVGASPELLIAKKGMRIFANPLAGSLPRSADAQEDAARANRLLHSTKDRHEHALVIAGIREALAPLCRNLSIPQEPVLVQTPTMWHLATPIEGELLSAGITVMALMLAMHPTPAVGGYPLPLARDFLRQAESFNRGLFTGAVGWCDAHGDGEWAVTIRCAELQGKKARLFAGAGVVPGSDPVAERRETGAKFATMLNALGVIGVPEEV